MKSKPHWQKAYFYLWDEVGRFSIKLLFFFFLLYLVIFFNFYRHQMHYFYYYLFNVQPLNLEQYNSIRDMSADIRSYAPDARVLTTYYCGKKLGSEKNNIFLRVMSMRAEFPINAPRHAMRNCPLPFFFLIISLVPRVYF